MDSESLISIDKAALEPIGKGAYGRVFLLKIVNPKIVMKVIHQELHLSKPQKELTILKELVHPNIVQYLDCPTDFPHHLPREAIFMEYCAEGSLRELITNPELNYTISTIVQWAEEIFSPIAYLKLKSIAHRDIKPENIFVDSDFHLKIGDFGLVKEFGPNSSSTTNHTMVGTKRYMMPELRDGLEMSIESIFKGDVYAAGWVLWELIRRKNLGKETEIEFPSTNCPNVKRLLGTIYESVHIEMRSRIALDVQVQVLQGWALKKLLRG